MARILFIDDDPYTLETMTRAVQLIGHQALQAKTGEIGFSLAAEQQPDLIFVDQGLPDMDGLTLIGRIHHARQTCKIPVLMLSAGPELDACDQALAAGACEYLNKPIRLQQLMDVIQHYTRLA